MDSDNTIAVVSEGGEMKFESLNMHELETDTSKPFDPFTNLALKSRITSLLEANFVPLEEVQKNINDSKKE